MVVVSVPAVRAMTGVARGCLMLGVLYLSHGGTIYP